MDRAYSILDVKAITQDEDNVHISGIASTPTTDRMGDVVEPMGAQFKTPMPLLWQHQSDQPVGLVTFAKPTRKGIPFEATLPIIKEAGRLKDRVDEAIQSIKYRLVAAVSIGFKPIEAAMERIETGFKFNQWEWLELSLVTIPANSEATITAIKSIDHQLRAVAHPPDDDPPVVTGTKATASRRFFFDPSKGKEMKTINEQIAALEAARAAKAARMSEIMQKSMSESRSTDDEERDEFDTLESEVRTADGDLRRLRQLESMNIQQARPVTEDKSYSRGPTIIIPKNDPDEKFAGQMYTRRVIAKALAYLSQGEATPIQIAEQRWGKSHPQFVAVLKADVAGGGSGSGEWGAELVQADTRYTGDFIEYLNARTVFNQLPLREIPANVVIKGQDGAATGYWVGESKGIGASKADFSTVTLSPLKVAALAVVSNELLRDSSPAAEMLVRDALVEAAAQKVDATFLSADAVSASVSPAGLLNGLTAIGSYGGTAEDLRGDIKNLYSPFISAKNATGLYYVMSPSLAKQIQLMRNALGQREFDGITASGGMLEGDPVVVGDNVTATHLILLKPSDIYKIGDGGVQVSMSRDASIEQDSAPGSATDTPVAQTGKVTSMFQSESTAIKVVRSMNFAKRRTSAVAYVDDATYGSYST